LAGVSKKGRFIMEKFYKCNHCGNIVGVLNDGKVTPSCCGEPMTMLEANTTDAAQEKHVPVIEKNGKDILVKVGSVPHPMLEEHFIQWIEVVQGNWSAVCKLRPGAEPEAKFSLPSADAPVTAYEYCNLHGLWKA
jgi:superoxide reductase